MLQRNGIGRRAVSAATDVSPSILQDVRLGRKKRIRALTERRILAVTPEQKSDSALVSATRTWSPLGELTEEGFSKAALARKLGFKTPAIQFRRDYVTAITELRVERLYQRLMA